MLDVWGNLLGFGYAMGLTARRTNFQDLCAKSLLCHIRFDVAFVFDLFLDPEAVRGGAP